MHDTKKDEAIADNFFSQALSHIGLALSQRVAWIAALFWFLTISQSHVLQRMKNPVHKTPLPMAMQGVQRQQHMSTGSTRLSTPALTLMRSTSTSNMQSLWATLALADVMNVSSTMSAF